MNEGIGAALALGLLGVAIYAASNGDLGVAVGTGIVALCIGGAVGRGIGERDTASDALGGGNASRDAAVASVRRQVEAEYEPILDEWKALKQQAEYVAERVEWISRAESNLKGLKRRLDLRREALQEREEAVFGDAERLGIELVALPDAGDLYEDLDDGEVEELLHASRGERTVVEELIDQEIEREDFERLGEHPSST